ncbi:MAG: DUF6518 family protein [Longibaculum sp.]
MRKYIIRPGSLFIIGLIAGIVSRLLDIYTQNLGNIFSQMAIWILLGTLISIYSHTKRQAMLNIFLFCLGMLMTYYTVAFMTHGVYSKTYIIAWTFFAMCSPIFAYFTWKTQEEGIFPKIISIGIVFVSILSSLILFDGLRAYDFIINGILIYILFFFKVSR